MGKFDHILNNLPYSRPFLFVDDIISLTDDSIEGIYTFREDEFFYSGHFKEQAVTPGVILTECMAQIGLVCLGLNLLENSPVNSSRIAFTESNVHFCKAVYPGETVRVIAGKKFWRMSKLKCSVEMYDSSGDRVCHGELAGFIKRD